MHWSSTESPSNAAANGLTQFSMTLARESSSISCGTADGR